MLALGNTPTAAGGDGCCWHHRVYTLPFLYANPVQTSFVDSPVVSPLAAWVESLLRLALSRLPALVIRRLAPGSVVRARSREPSPAHRRTLPPDRA
jgi:hypothetical protein